MNTIRKALLVTVLASLFLGVSVAGRTFVLVAQGVINECSQTYDPNLIIGDLGGTIHCYTGQTAACGAYYYVPIPKVATTRIRLANGTPGFVSLEIKLDPNSVKQEWKIVVQPTRFDTGMKYVLVLLEQLVDGAWQTEEEMTVVLCIEKEFTIEPLTGCQKR